MPPATTVGPTGETELHRWSPAPAQPASWSARWRAVSGSPVASLDELVPAPAASRGRRTRRRGTARRRDGRRGHRRARCSVAVELRRDELAVQVVLVVDGRDREVDLGGPVGRVAAVGSAYELVPLDEVPPRSCRGRRRDRRTGRARSASSTSTQRANVSSDGAAGAARRGASSSSSRRSTPATARATRGRGRGGRRASRRPRW